MLLNSTYLRVRVVENRQVIPLTSFQKKFKVAWMVAFNFFLHECSLQNKTSDFCRNKTSEFCRQLQLQQY